MLKMAIVNENFDNYLDAILRYADNLKESIRHLLQMIETDSKNISWPTMLDSFGIIASQLAVISKQLQQDIRVKKVPALDTVKVVPVMVSQHYDPLLQHMTEGRMSSFSHDIVSLYLRTKPDPIKQQQMNDFDEKAATLSVKEAAEEVKQFNDSVKSVLRILSDARDNLDTEPVQLPKPEETNLNSETVKLLIAVNTGKGLWPNDLLNGGSDSMMKRPVKRKLNFRTRIISAADNYHKPKYTS